MKEAILNVISILFLLEIFGYTLALFGMIVGALWQMLKAIGRLGAHNDP